MTPPHVMSFTMLDCNDSSNERCATGDLKSAEFGGTGVTITLNGREAPLTIPWAEFRSINTPHRNTID
jgi:hypothetical protein